MQESWRKVLSVLTSLIITLGLPQNNQFPLCTPDSNTEVNQFVSVSLQCHTDAKTATTVSLPRSPQALESVACTQLQGIHVCTITSPQNKALTGELQSDGSVWVTPTLGTSGQYQWSQPPAQHILLVLDGTTTASPLQSTQAKRKIFPAWKQKHQLWEGGERI